MKRMLVTREIMESIQSFPGLLGRGLIEALAWWTSKTAERCSFPGLLGRGLIEARGGGSVRAAFALAPSPVYWAGASLKRESLRIPPGNIGDFPGLLGRGLIEA